MYLYSRLIRIHLAVSCCFLGVLIGTPSGGAAEVFNCNGVWQNQPCGDSSQPVFNEIHRPPPSPAEQLRRKKELWLHDLEILRLETVRSYKLPIVTDDVRELCLNRTTSGNACRAAIEEKRSAITEQIKTALLQVATPVPDIEIEDHSATVIVNGRPRGYHCYLNDCSGKRVREHEEVNDTPKAASDSTPEAAPPPRPKIPQRQVWRR